MLTSSDLEFVSMIAMVFKNLICKADVGSQGRKFGNITD